jgi:serine/threonine-protein kinase
MDELGSPSTAPLAMPPSQVRVPSAPPAAFPSNRPSAPMPSAPPAYGSVPPAAHMSTAPAPTSVAPGSLPTTRQMEATQLVRQQGNGKTGMVVGIGLIALAAVVGFAVYMAVPRTGRIVVNAADAKGASVDQVDVYLDGKKQCDTTPCTIDQVAATDHSIKVSAQGYETSMKSITLESRKTQTLDFALVGTANKAGTGIKVAGNQPSVRLFVDGRELGPLPQEVRDLAPGDHKVRFAGSERYAPVERTITVTKDEMVDLGQVSLRVLKGKVTVQLGTPGAKVFIVTGTERHEVTPIPIALEIDTAKPARLEATKLGFNDYALPVTFDDGQAEKSITVTLDPKGTGNATASYAAPPPPQTFAPAPQPQQPAAAPAPKAQDTVAAAPKPSKPPPAQDTSSDSDSTDKPAKPAAAQTQGGDAFLTLNSLPAATVLLDGKPIGQTPKVKVPVTSGSHTVTFVNAEQQLKKTMQVTVGSGETKPVIAKLRDSQ